MHLRELLLSSVAVTLLASQATAQELVIDEPILVTPNRTPTEASKVGSAVSTVDQETIEVHAQPTLNDYLSRVPGVAVATQGGIGKETSLSVRGAPKRYVKTLFNGIDISDPTAPQFQTSYEHLLAGGIQRIEVLKGSQSTLYGSDAIAGVIDISTFGGVPVSGLRHTVFGEGGSFGTARGGYRMEGGFDAGRFDLSLGGIHTDGISAADARNGNSETDGYRNITGTFSGEVTLSENVSIFGSAFHINSDNEYDGFGMVGPADRLDFHATNVQTAGRAGINFDAFDARWKNTVSVQAFDLTRETFDDFPGVFEGRRQKVDYLTSFEFNPVFTALGGFEWERNTAETTAGIDASSSLASVWAQANVTPTDALSLTFGGRFDRHDAFGDFATWRATGSYLFDSGTRLHASAGSGFRAPSLYELYAPFGGNAALQPEESLSFDIGVEQTLLDGRLVADVTFFHLDIDNLIDYVFLGLPTDGYQQVAGVSRQKGVEASLTYSATDWLDLGASYTYTHTRKADGTRHVRVPMHDIGLSAVVRPAEKWTLSATGKIALDTVDGFGGSVELKDYFLLDAKIAYKPTEDTEIYLRGANLLNQKYQLVDGYGTPGAAVYAGFRASF